MTYHANNNIDIVWGIFMTKLKWQIRPLSTGMGLGSLTTVTHVTPSINPSALESDGPLSSQDLPPFLESLKPDEVATRRQAQSAYAPYSVASSIRQQPSVRFGTGFIRFCSGFGLDLVVAISTAMVVAWAGVLAWNAGAAGTVNILDSMSVIKDFLVSVTPLFLGIGALFLTLCWRCLRYVVS